MKRYLFLVSLFAGALLVSCNQDLLDIPQKGVVGYDDFYITDEDAESAAVTMYADFAQNIGGQEGTWVPYTFGFNNCADNMLAAGNFYTDNDFSGELNEFRYDDNSQVISTLYKRFYWTNHKCNLITDNFKYGDSDVKDRVISEARVIRAWIHMMLAIGWGDPPLVDHVLEGSDKPSNYMKGEVEPEEAHRQLLLWCAKECEEAAPYLDERKSTSDRNSTVRATQGLAWTVAGKAYVFAGEMEKAKAALKNVINSKKYALVPGERWTENFHKVGDGNEEKIFETNINYNPALGDWGGQIQRSTWMQSQIWTWRTDKMATKPSFVGMDGWGGCGIRESFAQEMIDWEGDSYRRKGTFVTMDEFIEEVPWKSDATVTDKWSDPERGIKDVGGLFGMGKYLPWKHICTTDDVVAWWGHDINFMIFRYAEVLLLYAEASVGNDSDGLGLKCLNDIQKRAGAPVTSLTLENVKREKNYEMWLEGTRWPDMVRWGKTDKNEFAIAKKAGYDHPTLYDAYFTKGESKHRFYVEYANGDQLPREKGFKVGFQEGKHERFPFPYGQTSINPNLRQNPGWN